MNTKKLLILSLLITKKEIKENSVLKSFICFLKQLTDNSEENILEAYSNFVSLLNETNEKDFSNYLYNLMLKNKNSYSSLEQFEKEVTILSFFSKISFEDVQNAIKEKCKNLDEITAFLPRFENSKTDFNQIPQDIIKTSSIFDTSKAFIFDNDFEIKAVDYCENITFANLKGYENQKNTIFKNTAALIEGKKVNNILLYGDAGCGKSSTVRALLNEFNNLKMVQVFKNNLINLGILFNKLKDIPYKFIIFADDISFDENDTAFSTMKAILEGSLIQCPNNVAIYATSNRRHLIKETFKSRTGDEIHLNDTINELNSLSERFGINLLFQKPTMKEYLNIVLELAHDNNIEIDKECLIEKAKNAAITKGSTSPRVAKQLIDNILAYVNT